MRTPPTPFTINVSQLDSNEQFIINNLNLNVDNWARFRHAIAVGTDSSVLTSVSGGSITNEVVSAYCDFGRNHYDAITSLGAAKLIQVNATLSTSSPPLPLADHIAIMGFYHNLGSVLDALSRIIYLLCEQQAPYEQTRNGRLKRHTTDWGRASQLPNLGSFQPLFSNAAIDEVRNVRNSLTHSWMPIARVASSGDLEWPDNVTSARNIPWPHDRIERQAFNQQNASWTRIRDFFASHHAVINDVFNDVFRIAETEIPTFEGWHGITI